MSTKRKHVVFSEAEADTPAPAAPSALEPAPAPTGPVIHPSRMAGNAILAKTAGTETADPASKKSKVRLTIPFITILTGRL
jgi:hypothetical protein